MLATPIAIEFRAFAFEPAIKAKAWLPLATAPFKILVVPSPLEPIATEPIPFAVGLLGTGLPAVTVAGSCNPLPIETPPLPVVVVGLALKFEPMTTACIAVALVVISLPITVDCSPLP